MEVINARIEKQLNKVNFLYDNYLNLRQNLKNGIHIISVRNIKREYKTELKKLNNLMEV